jgi:hypothetical protein
MVMDRLRMDTNTVIAKSNRRLSSSIAAWGNFRERMAASGAGAGFWSKQND